MEYEREPVIAPGETFPVKVTFRHADSEWANFVELIQCSVALQLPEGWTADYRKRFHIVRKKDLFETPEQNVNGIRQNEYTFTVTAGDLVAAQNQMFLILSSPMFAQPFTIPMTLLG